MADTVDAVISASRARVSVDFLIHDLPGPLSNQPEPYHKHFWREVLAARRRWYFLSTVDWPDWLTGC
jgi:hypothetical protein